MKTVTSPGWSVSCTTGYIPGVSILSVTRHYDHLRNNLGGLGRIAYGDHHGRHFESTDAAMTFALERGYLQEYRTPWCRHCRVLHMSPMGSKTAFCIVRKEFCR